MTDLITCQQLREYFFSFLFFCISVVILHYTMLNYTGPKTDVYISRYFRKIGTANNSLLEANECRNVRQLPGAHCFWPLKKIHFKGGFSRIYVSEAVDLAKVDKTKFNLIAAACGTGKSYFARNDLLKYYPDILPSEVIFITSRSLVVQQQAREKNMQKFNPNNKKVIKYWNDDSDIIREMRDIGVNIMTYDKIINVLISDNTPGKETLGKVKMIIVDECHTIVKDTFIRNIEAFKVWIRDVLYTGKKIIIGMTATPAALESGANNWGVQINRLNDDICFMYKAKKMICADYNALPHLFRSKELQSKSMIMAASVSAAYRLHEQIPNSAVLVSRNSEKATKEMENIRSYIANHEMLPKTYRGEDGKLHPLKVLIATSTAREGFNLCEESGVRNVVCCYGDSLNITQFAGRARYNLDTIVVAQDRMWQDGFEPQACITEEHELFDEFMAQGKLEWFRGVANLVQHDVYGVHRYRLTSEEDEFIAYINKRWLVPEGMAKKDAVTYRIYRKTDKEDIVRKFNACRMAVKPTTYKNVMRVLQETLGYTVIDCRDKSADFDGDRYRLIVAFDKNAVTYQKQVPQYPKLTKE